MSETGQYLRTHLQSLKQEQTTTAKAAYEFKFTPVQLLNDELPLHSLLDDGSREPQVPQGASAHFCEHDRADPYFDAVREGGERRDTSHGLDV